MKTITPAGYTSYDVARARFTLREFSPNWNNHCVFWSSPDSGYASYILMAAPDDSYAGIIFIAPNGDKVRLVSVNGCGEERWTVMAATAGKSDLEAIAYWGLVPFEK